MTRKRWQSYITTSFINVILLQQSPPGIATANVTMTMTTGSSCGCDNRDIQALTSNSRWITGPRLNSEIQFIHLANRQCFSISPETSVVFKKQLTLSTGQCAGELRVAGGSENNNKLHQWNVYTYTIKCPTVIYVFQLLECNIQFAQAASELCFSKYLL